MKPGEGLTNKIMDDHYKFTISRSTGYKITRFTPFTNAVVGDIGTDIVKDFLRIHFNNDRLCNHIADVEGEQ